MFEEVGKKIAQKVLDFTTMGAVNGGYPVHGTEDEQRMFVQTVIVQLETQPVVPSGDATTSDDYWEPAWVTDVLN